MRRMITRSLVGSLLFGLCSASLQAQTNYFLNSTTIDYPVIGDAIVGQANNSGPTVKFNPGAFVAGQPFSSNPGSVYVYGSSQFNMSGGSIGNHAGGYSGQLKAYNNSKINITGGNMYCCQTSDASQVTVTGGTLLYMNAFGSSSVKVTGGCVSSNDILTLNNSSLYFGGGAVGQRITAGNNSVATITGGKLQFGVKASDYASITISGGNFQSLYIDNFATIKLIGSNFAISNPVVTGYTTRYTLSGTLADGTSLNGKWVDFWLTPGTNPQLLFAAGAATPATTTFAGQLNFEGIAPRAGTQTVTFVCHPLDGSGDTTSVSSVMSGGDFSVSGLQKKQYVIHIKGSKYLASNVNVDLTQGNVYLYGPQMPTLAAGDANNDNSVDATDFGLLVRTYNTSASVPGSGYDIRADFNGDGNVDATDFGLFVENYNSDGDP